MRITKSVIAAAALSALGSAAMAEGPVIYPYASGANYCPAGLQPVTISGVICCGTPTTNQSYQSVMAHPAPKKKHHHKKKRHVHVARSVDTCPEGVKGCY